MGVRGGSDVLLKELVDFDSFLWMYDVVGRETMFGL